MGLKLTVNCAFPDPLPRHPLFRRVTLLCGHPPLSSGIWRPNIASMPHEHEPQYTPLTTLSRPESSPVLPTFHHSLRLLRRLQNPFYPQLLADVTKKLRDALPKGNSSSSSPPSSRVPTNSTPLWACGGFSGAEDESAAARARDCRLSMNGSWRG